MRLLLVIRSVSVLMGAALAFSVVTGGMNIRVFIIPDLLLSAGLVAAGLLPERVVRRALLAANAFAAGVFTVATSRYVIEDGFINPALILYLALSLLFAILLLVQLHER